MFGIRLFVPSKRVNSINDINFHDLRKRCNVCVFDKDGCISNGRYLDPRIKPGMKECLDVFGYDNVFVYSNSIFSVKDAESYTKTLGLRVLPHKLRKPFLDVRIEGKVCFIGDKILTDVLFANRNKWYSIKVNTLLYSTVTLFAKLRGQSTSTLCITAR